MTRPEEYEQPVSRGNLSAWGGAHPALVLFLIIVCSVAGVVSYLNLGRAEDPSFAIKTMVITAAWPGATAEQMQVSLAQLKDYAEIVRQRLLRTEGVAKVDIVGERQQRIFIEFSHRKLATLGITPQAIFDSVARQNAVTSAGTIDTSADRIDVRVTGAFKGEAAIAEVPIEAGGRP